MTVTALQAPEDSSSTQEEPALLGSLLIEAKIIKDGDLANALEFQERFGGRLGSILIRLGSISEEQLLPVISRQLGISLLKVDLLEWDISGAAEFMGSSGIELSWWIDQEVVAWPIGEQQARVIARDPIDPLIHEVLYQGHPDWTFCWSLCRQQDLKSCLDMLSGGLVDIDGDDVGRLKELAEEAPIIELVNNIMSQSLDQNASDIHIEPEDNAFRVRFRIDGILYTKHTLQKERFNAVVSRIKLTTGMNIAERRLPQDGRLSARINGKLVDIRASSVPGVNGESVVLRLLVREEQRFVLENLGFEPDHLATYREMILSPHGIILLTGPTGSGKSTTLYSTLRVINSGEKKILTVEDPVEYRIEGLTQIQTLSEIGYTFATALRAILRQDPDVLMIGEIRDLETAEIAVQASLTGHLVFSTVHTNDAISAFTRLIDMGVEPFLLATSVRAVIAQRLVRRLCEYCARETTPPLWIQDILRDLRQRGVHLDDHWKVATGCPHCRGTGYRGRMAIYEMIFVTPELQNLITHGVPSTEMLSLAVARGARILREDGLIKASRGLTSTDEVIRVTGGTHAQDIAE